MAMKKLKPTSPGSRNTVLIDRSELAKKGPKKNLTSKVHSKAGRNSRGVITVRHRGGAVKRKYRHIDFARSKRDIEGIVDSIEHDPNRSAFIALIKYSDGDWRYILAPDELSVGDKVNAGTEVPLKPGNALPLSSIPQGMYVHAVELWSGQGAVLGRAAGTSVQVMGGDKGYVQLKLPSGELRLVKETCYATLGTVSNPDLKNVKLGTAGRARRKGKRPETRGVAMSYKHPHAGGQGKSGRHGPGGPAKDMWGNKLGTRTRKNRKITGKYIVRRRPSKNKFKKYKTVI